MIKADLKDFQLPRDRLMGIYLGVVEDNNDPLKMGRCRVRVFGVHSSNKNKTGTDGVPTEELIWAEPALSLFEGAVSKYGFWTIPLQGSCVYVFFAAGNPLQPRFFASCPGKPTQAPNPLSGFNDPDGQYPDKINEVDWDNGGGQYPHNIVMHTHGGHVLEIDSTPGNKRIKLLHSSGTYILIDNDGDVNIFQVKDQIRTVENSETINIIDDSTENIGGIKTLNITGDAIETDLANKTITVSGNFTINVTGNVAITAGGSVSITGNPVNIN